ncbi:PadR family transcriptional regulator [Kaistia dalseonensis]|uniref:DNA-binding PadR family transcriptional regulator n=1 Tax=Kaistia dalseonensis TaxID=410840 RepID=A0ABU0H1H1_9HYPH|nr:PadR family transcriptional regulator [Kaistia dalseonensis]MCX5493586.1 PadR family transcriptional regulator [Kaistia dalseonensis]MDQ0436146.1 DNA-binding PadR family transcriptional regulator [Kaistia dalseonensis]
MSRKLSNPLALAVLAILSEKPSHPYDIAATLRQRQKDDSIKLNYGSLYAIVESLVRHRWIEPHEKEKSGNRPERTVYGLTEAGAHELSDWMGELISRPAKEFTQFEAGLSLIGVLIPEEAVELLKERCRLLEIELNKAGAVRSYAQGEKLPKLFMIEFEYRNMLHAAELAWVRELIEDIEAGSLDGLDLWRNWHKAGLSEKEWPGSSQ